MGTAIERNWVARYVILPFAIVGTILFAIILLTAFGPTWFSSYVVWA